MTQPYIGEIQLFGFDFAPMDWAFCNGATLSVAQNTALFSLIGSIYGGNDQTTFQLPNLAARTACSQGQGPGLSNRQTGHPFGEAEVTLTNNEMPAHQHGFTLYSQPDRSMLSGSPASGSALVAPHNALPFPAKNTAPDSNFLPAMLGTAGQSQPHENRQPGLAINYCIALDGIYPSFS